MNVEAVGGRNTSNVGAYNRSQTKRYFMFYCVLFHFICILLPCCAELSIVLFIVKFKGLKKFFSLYAFIMNKSVLLCFVFRVD